MKHFVNTPVEVQLIRPDETVSNVTVTDEQKNSWSIPTFKKADGLTYFRFASSTPGTYFYRYTIETGKIVLEPYKGTNLLQSKGPITVSKDKRYLVYADGTPFFYLADTWWFGGSKRMPFPDIFKDLAKRRKSQHFTAIQIVCGVPPEVEATSHHSANEGGKPFRRDWSLNPSYFDEFDKRIKYLVELGLVPVIFGGWGHHMDWLGFKGMKRLWREIVARYSSYPVIFSLAGEIDSFLTPQQVSGPKAHNVKQRMVGFLGKFPSPIFSAAVRTKHAVTNAFFSPFEKRLLKTRITKFAALGRYVYRTDAYHRPLTAHVQRKITLYELMGKQDFLAIDTIQSGHDLGNAGFLIDSARKNSDHLFINLEPWYEGIRGDFYEEWQRYAFWMSLLSGAKGHTYGAHGLWQMATKDAFMRHWGVSDYRAAISFDGAAQIGKSVEFISKLNWWELKPDTTLVSPHAGIESPMQPVSASIGQEFVLIYIPKLFLEKQINIILPQNWKKATLSWYDPIDFREIRTQEIETSYKAVKLSQNPDLVVLLKNESKA